jgi:hypothetical protein
VRRVGDECASVDQHLLLYGRGYGSPLFAKDQEPLVSRVDVGFMSRKRRHFPDASGHARNDCWIENDSAQVGVGRAGGNEVAGGLSPFTWS